MVHQPVCQQLTSMSAYAPALCIRVCGGCEEQQYYLLARRWHPDKFSGRPEAEVEAANERFQKIAEAYQVLSDPALREKYDNFGKAGAGAGVSVVDPVTAFSMVFGSGKVRRMRIPPPPPLGPPVARPSSES